VRASTMQPALQAQIQINETYEPRRHPSFHRAIHGLLIHATALLRPLFPSRAEAKTKDAPSTAAHDQKMYEKPTVKKLTSDQARLLLLGHASAGNQDAKDIVELVFPDPEKPE
jgi:hypothetical protein